MKNDVRMSLVKSTLASISFSLTFLFLVFGSYSKKNEQFDTS